MVSLAAAMFGLGFVGSDAFQLPASRAPGAPVAHQPRLASAASRATVASRSGAASDALCGGLGLAAVAAAAAAVAVPRHQRRSRRAASAPKPSLSWPSLRGLVARRAWGDDVTFHTCTVTSNVEECEGLRLIEVEAPPEVTSAYEKGGQFVQAKGTEDAKPSFYAICSPPPAEADGDSASKLEFLIKQSESNEWLTGSGSGDKLLLSAAMGKGYDVGCEAWGDTVNQVGLFATGSGIAPLRAVIESGALKGKVSRLYLGARTGDAIPFSDRHEAWEKEDGIEVVTTCSQPASGWKGRKGYVQDVFREDEERGEGWVLAPNHGALLCGQKEMVAAVREVYADLGVPEERTLLNF